MAKLIGAQRMVLQAILDLPADSAGFVNDSQIAQLTQITVTDVRDWIETLEGEGLVNVARITGGLSASITASGRQALRLYQPTTSTPGPAQSTTTQPIVKGTPASTSPASTGQPDARPTVPRQPISLFFSYSHDDESLRNELAKHLSLLKREGVISAWHDRMIGAGDDWKQEIDRNLEDARVVLLLVSASFIASDYCFEIETKRAIERHDRGEARVIPILVRPCDWKSAPFARLTALPSNWKAVTSWTNQDEAWTDVALGIRRAVEAMTANPR